MAETSRARTFSTITLLAAGLLCTLVVALSLGPTTVPFAHFIPDDLSGMLEYIISAQVSGTSVSAGELAPFFPDETSFFIVYLLRLPRVIAAVLVGAGLAAAGTAMQGLFRNSMADPYIIGTSSGGAFGAAFTIVFMGGFLLPLFAFLGAVGSTFLVYAIATRNGRAPVETLLLTGIAISMFFSSILSFLMYSAGNSLHQIVFWLMGGLWNVSWNDVWLGLLIPVGGILLIFFGRDLNILSLGEEDALHLGVNVEQFKRVLLFVSSALTAVAVSIAGAIGFIGLITPHVMRLLVGPDHRILFPTAMIAGGLFLLIADTVARSFLGEMPVGVITSFFGAPFFILLLRRRMPV